MPHVLTPTSLGEAEALDAADPLAAHRDQFLVPEGVTYLVGHSLGPATKPALGRVATAAQTEWQEGMVRSWNSAGWIDLASKAGARLAPLVGARASELVIADSVSVNLFKLIMAALPLARAQKIVVEAEEFPTDQYIAEEAARIAGAAFERTPGPTGTAGASSGGVWVKSLVNYRAAELFDMKALEEEAARHGTVIVWDLSHGAGVVPIDLHGAGARFATGCTYKYINGGPGAPSFLFIADEVSASVQNPLPGWLGHKEPFAFKPDYEPADGASQFVSGTPSILSLSALDGALSVFEAVTSDQLADKARALGDIVIARADGIGLAVSSPRDGVRRGGHVSLRHPDGYPIVQALFDRGVHSDFRTPDTIRFGLSPLFLSYADVWRVMDTLEEVLSQRLYDDPAYRVRAKVT